MTSVDRDRKCAYQSLNDHVCPFPPHEDSELCFWHCPNADKSGPEVGPTLVKLISEKHDCQGFQLAGVELRRLPMRDARMTRANFHGAILDKTNLEGGSFFGANFTGASLFKVNLDRSSLRSVHLDGTNLLGATLIGARLEGADFGPDGMVVNERQARKAAAAGHSKIARRRWREAEEVYLELNQAFSSAGRSDEAGEMYYRFMVARRMLMPVGSVKRMLSWLTDVTCGYGEYPLRVVGVYVGIIVFCAMLYFFLGVTSSHAVHVGELWTDEPDMIQFDPAASIETNVGYFIDCLYFSIITITTTGYGDMTPNDPARPVAAVEAFLGTLLIAMLVMVIGRRTMRG